MLLAMGLALVLLVILIGLWWPWLRQYGRLSWRWPLGL
ncbi:TPA: cytochrome C heme lyase, partial [Yersinia enterocolitica]